jgi:hypothetical protein
MSNSRSEEQLTSLGEKGPMKRDCDSQKPSAVFFFLSNFSGLSIAIAGSGSG